ncbi:MAG: FlgD immunoglobulin-like domain containing protein, partial [bacterium]
VHTLVEESKAAGFHEVHWNGKNDKGQNVSAGIYLYQITTREFRDTKKMLFLK